MFRSMQQTQDFIHGMKLRSQNRENVGKSYTSCSENPSQINELARMAQNL